MLLKHAIGIDLGGTKIKFGLVDTIGNLIYEGIMPTDAEKGADKVIENLISAVKLSQQYAAKNNLELIAVGIGTPGIVDRTNRIVIGGSDNIEGWLQLALSDIIEEACELPVTLNNDANMMGLGEQAFGAAQDCSDVLFLTIGTGIGGAIIINGKLFGGFDNRGTELGHIPLFTDGIPCSCGSVGCLEAYASTTALTQQFQVRCDKVGKSFKEEITGKLIIDLYKQQDAIAIESLHEHCRYLGRGIAGLVNIFSPQRVVLGGGISESGAFYIERIKEYYLSYVMPDCAVNTEICAAALGNKAGVLGAAQWAIQNI